MLDDGKKKVRWGRRIMFAILFVFGAWLLATSFIFVPPHTMVAVRGWDGTTAFVNEGDKKLLKLRLYIPNVIGYKEEEVKLPAVKEDSTSFAFYTADQVTGESEDIMKARAYFIDVKFKVTDWLKYLKIDLDELNEERKQAGPYYPLIKLRAGIIADLIASVIRSGGTVDRFGRPIKTEDGRPAMDLSSRINYFQGELTSRRNIVICLMDAFGLKTLEEIKNYLKEKEPWMYFAGVSTFEQLADQFKEIQEYTMSELVKGLTPEGGQQRFIFGTDRLKLFAQAHRAWLYQGFLMDAKQNLEQIDLQRKEFTENVDKVYSKDLRLQAELFVDSFKAWIKISGGDIQFIPSQDRLNQDYQMFVGQIQYNIALAFRGAGIEALKEAVMEAEKQFIKSPLEEEERLEAEKIVIDFFDLMKQEVPAELGQLSNQELTEIYKYYEQESNLKENLSPKTLSYVGLKITAAYVEAVAEKTEEAEKFLAEIKIAKEFYEDMKVKLQGQQVDSMQAVEEYFQTKGDLLQVGSYFINFSWQEGIIGRQKVQWETIVEEELIPFFQHYLISDDELPMAMRRITAEENEALWDAAIQEVLEGKDITQYSSIWIHYLKEGETLAQIIQEYDVSWKSLFGPTPRQIVMQMVFRSLLEEEETVEFNQLVTQAMESGDYTVVYEFAKDIPLKSLPGRMDNVIFVSKVEEEYSEEWFELDEINREKREKIIKRYFWPWVEKFASRVIEDYFYSPDSPWVDYVENMYGVELLEVKLRIENDEIVDKGGSIRLEYYDLYKREAENWTVEEEEEKEE